MADGGIQDILIPYNIVGQPKPSPSDAPDSKRQEHPNGRLRFQDHR